MMYTRVFLLAILTMHAGHRAAGWALEPEERTEDFDEDDRDEDDESHGRALAGGSWCNKYHGGSSCDSSCNAGCDHGCDRSFGRGCDLQCDSYCDSGCDAGCSKPPSPPPPSPRPSPPPPPEITQLAVQHLNENLPAIVDLVRKQVPDSYVMDTSEMAKNSCKGAASWYGCVKYSLYNVVVEDIKQGLDLAAVGNFEINTHDVRNPDGSVSASISMAATLNQVLVNGELMAEVRARALGIFGGPSTLFHARGTITTKVRGTAIISAEAKVTIDPNTHCLSVAITSVELNIVKTSLVDRGNELDAEGKLLGMCQGDCDKDSDCKKGFICHQRTDQSRVPGCFGGGREDWDYCTYTADISGSPDLDLYNYDIDLRLNTPFGNVNMDASFILALMEDKLLDEQMGKRDIITEDKPATIPGCLAKIDDEGLADYAMLPPGWITDFSKCPAPTILNDADSGKDKIAEWEDLEGACPAFPVDSCLGTTAASPLAELRQSSLQCLASLNFPLVDNPSWNEFGEKCASFTAIDGTSIEVPMAEPRNALSNAAYDHLVCRQDSPGLHTSASLLGFGSFAFHAKGAIKDDKETEEDEGKNVLLHKFDVVGMKCLTVSIFHDALVRTGTSTTVDIEGKTYDIAALKHEHCETALPAALRSCESEDVAEAYGAAYGAIPDYDKMISMLLIASMHHCYGGTAIGLTQQAIGLMHTKEQAEALASFRFTSPRALTPSDYTDDKGFCRNINYFVSNFVCGLAVQGDMLAQAHPMFDDKEDHALWHTTSAEAVNHAAIAIESLA